VHGHFFVVTAALALGAILFATFIGLVAGLLRRNAPPNSIRWKFADIVKDV